MRKILLLSCVAVTSIHAAHTSFVRSLVRKPGLQCVAGSSLHNPRLYSSRSNSRRTAWEDVWRDHKEEIIITGVGIGVVYGGYCLHKQYVVTSLNSDYNDLIKAAGAINNNAVVRIGQTHGKDLGRLTDAIRTAGYDGDVPLVAAFEAWKKADARIDGIFSALHRVSESQEQLTKKNNKAPIASFDPSQFEDLSRVQEELRAAMVTVKDDPDWLKQVDSNNIKLAKEAAEDAALDARAARSSARHAAVMSTIALVVAADNPGSQKR